MKRIISTYILLLLLIFNLTISVYALETKEDNLLDGYTVYYEHICNDEEKVDYLLIKESGEAWDDCHYWKYFGDYVVRNTTGEPLNYYIYLVDQKQVVSLEEAIARDVCCVGDVFTEYGLGELLGDLDKDRRLTIMDVSVLQCCLAGLSEFPSDDYIDGYYGIEQPNPYGWSTYLSDMNRDGQRSILDATAIQLKLAGIE